MKTINKWMTAILLFTSFACSGGEEKEIPELPTPPTTETPVVKDDTPEKIAELKSQLCFGGKFVDRELEDLSAKGHAFKAVVKQKDYIFKEDGTGELTTYIITDENNRGYNSSEEAFSWSISETKPLAVKIQIGDMTSLVLEEAAVGEDNLKFKTGSWAKEILLNENISSQEMLSYSAEGLYSWCEMYNSISRVYITPAILSVRTTKGVMRFIREGGGTNTVGYQQSYYEKTTSDGYSSGYYPENIYLSVSSSNNIFYSTKLSKDELSFKENKGESTLYNFLIGNVTEDHQLSMISNNESYDIE